MALNFSCLGTCVRLGAYLWVCNVRGLAFTHLVSFSRSHGTPAHLGVRAGRLLCPCRVWRVGRALAAKAGVV